MTEYDWFTVELYSEIWINKEETEQKTITFHIQLMTTNRHFHDF